MKRIKKQSKKKLLNLKNVNSVGIGYKIKDGKPTSKIGVIVGVEKKEPLSKLDPSQVIPKNVDDIETDVIEIGRVEALYAKQRPALGGVSVGHYKITAGTLGITISKPELLIVSNNHVLSNENNCKIGDDILQPGPLDGGILNDKIASLIAYEPIHFIGEPLSDNPIPKDESEVPKKEFFLFRLFKKALNWLFRILAIGYQFDIRENVNTDFNRSYKNINSKDNNLVDVAIARPVDSHYVKANQINHVGSVSGTSIPTLGMNIKKTGRTTGYTHGIVEILDLTVQVYFSDNRIALFNDQVGISVNMVQGGDSGSLVVEADSNKAVGLIFAGSHTLGIMNDINNVKKCFGGLVF